MKKILVILLSIWTVGVFSQEDVLKNPEAASLERYGDIEVGEYTGKPNISVPLYTVKIGDLNFPINLYYDATGIRVDQEATWVGLGWELSTIAAINYRAVAENDQSSVYINTPWDLHEILINDIIDDNPPYKKQPYAGYMKWHFDGGQHTPIGCYEGLNSNNESSFLQILNKSYEGYSQIDYFQINCPGLSGSFYVHPGTGEIKAYGEKNKYKVLPLNNRYGFEIITEDGVKYIFTAQESNPKQHINAWFLTEIRSLKSNHWIKFKYDSFGEINPIKSFIESIKTGYDPASEGVVAKLNYDSNAVIESLFLTEIETDLETIRFNLDSSREDLQGVGKRKLQSIRVENKINNDINKWRHFEFDYGYYNGVNIGNDYYKKEPFIGSSHTTPDYFKKRLKLLSVTERVGVESPDDNVKTYSFDYNTTQLPYKTSFAKDFWGFYNGVGNNTFIPSLTSLLVLDPGLRNMFLNNHETSFTKYFGNNYNISDKAKRGADEDYMKAGILTAIHYPTGGKTEFSYEPHTFNNQTILSPSEEDQIMASSGDYYSVYNNGSTSANTQEVIELSEDTWVTVKGNINNGNGRFTCMEMASSSLAITRFADGPYPIPDNSEGITSRSYSFDCTYGAQVPAGSGNFVHNQPIPEDEFLLAPGIYTFRAYTSAPFVAPNSWDPPVVSGTIKLNQFKTNLNEIIENNTSQSIGGGLRIKEITNYDSNDSFISKKQYSYSEGSLMSRLKLSRTLRYGTCNGFTRYTGTRYMSSVQNNYTGPVGATVGYNKVTIEQIDRNSIHNGKIEKHFNNNPLSPAFSLFNSYLSDDSLLNGEIDSIAYYNKSGNIIKKEIFNYDIFESEANFVNILVQLNYNTIGECVESLSVLDIHCEPLTTSTFYPYPYISYKKLLEEKKTIDYLDDKELEQTIAYVYNMDNYLPNSQSIVNSNGDIIKNEYQYPTTYATYGVYPYNIMVSEKNWLTPVIVEEQKVNGQVVNKKTVEYNGFGSVIAPKTSKTGKQGDLETVVEYEKYNFNGNLQQYTLENGITISVIWGYNNTHPIARIENGTYTEIATALSLPNAGAVEVLDETDMALINSLRTQLPKAMVTTYTYTPLVGITSITDPKGYTMYYEYDDFNRLEFVKDAEEKLVSENKYHYKN